MAFSERVDDLTEIVPHAGLVGIDLAGRVVLSAAGDKLRVRDVSGVRYVPCVRELAVVRNLSLHLQGKFFALLHHRVLRERADERLLRLFGPLGGLQIDDRSGLDLGLGVDGLERDRAFREVAVNILDHTVTEPCLLDHRDRVVHVAADQGRDLHELHRNAGAYNERHTLSVRKRLTPLGDSPYDIPRGVHVAFLIVDRNVQRHGKRIQVIQRVFQRHIHKVLHVVRLNAGRKRQLDL